VPTNTIRARAAQAEAAPSAVAIDATPDTITAHLEDAAHFPGGHADGFARPRTEAEVAWLLHASPRVLPIGAQSSVTGGATPDGGLILSTERLTSIRDVGSTHVRAGAGVPLVLLQQRLAERGRWYPPVPTFTGAWVGGVASTNAAGAATFKYGTTRDWVGGLTVVLACGCVLEVERGSVAAGRGRGFEIGCLHGTRAVRPGTYRMPAVPKCSAGYFAAPDMDLIDLFVGAEGTLGVIVDVTLRVLPGPPAVAIALVPAPSEAAGLALVRELRTASRHTWSTRDARGIDIAAIESLDRRCLEVLREDGADRRADVTISTDTDLLLMVQLELPSGTTGASAFDAIAGALLPDAPDSALTRFCRLLDRHGMLDQTEMAMPGDARRAEQLLALREAAPTGVNRRVGDVKRRMDDRIAKTAADMIVPFEHFAEMMAIYRDGYQRRGLDFAIWGHVSDGNVHPNVIPRSYGDVAAGKDAILEFGREAKRLGGCPLAEHGVGRSALKQELLERFYGLHAIAEMRAIKAALDPDWKLAPGVIFGREPSNLGHH
jgi:D-lactate dehydrogenase (cytochrome)